MTKPCAEIIESSLQTFLGQCWQWDIMPQFGSLVIAQNGNRPLFGLVYQIQTGSMDPTRYPFAYQKTHEELRAEQPQIFEFLKTSFSCLCVGYQEKGRIYYITPPEPPKIHSFLQIADDEMARLFFAKNSYLPLLFGFSSPIPIDELLLALLKQQNTLKTLKNEAIRELLQSYSLLVGNDYRRLKLFAQRLQSFIDK
jgi:hypothetical protein